MPQRNFLVGPMLGSLSDRFGRRPMLIACLSGTSLAYLLLAVADSLPLLGLALLIDGVTGGNLSIAQAYIADSTTPDRRARGLGLVGAAFGLGLMVGPVLGGVLSLTDLSAPALVASALALANMLLTLALLPESLPPERRRSFLLDGTKQERLSAFSAHCKPSGEPDRPVADCGGSPSADRRGVAEPGVLGAV